MAKKKSKPKEEDELEELEDELLEDIEGTQIGSEDDELLEEEYEYEIEELPEEPEYKYLDLSISKGAQQNDYKISVEGQSHGFLNIFVKHLLNIEGVNSAAYKVTQIDPPEVFVRVEDGYKIKDILHKGIQSLKNDVVELQKLFKNIMK